MYISRQIDMYVQYTYTSTWTYWQLCLGAVRRFYGLCCRVEMVAMLLLLISCLTGLVVL